MNTTAPYPPDALCRCGHAGRHHRVGDIQSVTYACYATGWHKGVPGYDGSGCFAFEPDQKVVVLRRDSHGRFRRVAGAA